MLLRKILFVTVLTGLTTAQDSLSSSTQSTSNWYCPFASDNSGMPQTPQCCDSKDIVDPKNGATFSTGCVDASSVREGDNECGNGTPVRCCYAFSGGPYYVCTAKAEWND